MLVIGVVGSFVVLFRVDFLSASGRVPGDLLPGFVSVLTSCDSLVLAFELFRRSSVVFLLFISHLSAVFPSIGFPGVVSLSSKGQRLARLSLFVAK